MHGDDASPTAVSGAGAAPFSPIEDALADLRAGKMLVVWIESEGFREAVLMLAARHATVEAINFMSKEARGLICLALTPERCKRLRLELMAANNESPFETPFTVSIAAREGVNSGVSAAGRARTIEVAIDDGSSARDLVRPGHVFPVRAKPGGVLERMGQTEAAVDLARAAGLDPSGVICEILDADGAPASIPHLVAYCERHALKMVTVADVIAYRRKTEPLIERVVSTDLPTRFGDFTAVGYRSLVDDGQHMALVAGEVAGAEDVLVRVHSQCVTGDVLRSCHCGCRRQLEQALATIGRAGRGVLLYLAQDGHGLDLLGELHPADPGDPGVGVQMLADLGLTSIRVLTHDPTAPITLTGHGVTVTEQVVLESA